MVLFEFTVHFQLYPFWILLSWPPLSCRISWLGFSWSFYKHLKLFYSDNFEPGVLPNSYLEGAIYELSDNEITTEGINE